MTTQETKTNIVRKQQFMMNERGSALIIAILLLAIMSILGVVTMNTTTTEIQLSGNYRNLESSFYVADRTLEYAMRSASDGSGEVDLYNDINNNIASAPTHRSLVVAGDPNSDLEADDTATTDDDDKNSVTYITTGPPPVGSKSDATSFVARIYAANAVGIFPSNATNPSRTELKIQFAKIVPK